MRAIVHRAYGPPDLLTCEDVDRPIPGDGEVLVRVRAAAVNPFDWHIVRGTPLPMRVMTGLGRPRDRRLGVDVAGHVEAVGGSVTRFRPGDEVFGACTGAFAEYARASESEVVVKPAGVTFERAAALPVAGITALQGLRDAGRVQPGRKVLINGASGGVGTFAVQIARWLGAHVTGVCSARNVDRVRSIGADRVIDYGREDFTEGGERYDVIFDCVVDRSFSARRRVLNPDGVCVMVGGGGPDDGRWFGLLAGSIRAALLSPFVSQRFVFFMARPNREDLTLLGELVEAGTVTPVIDRRYPLSEVPAAIRYVEEGHARGKVIIAVE